MRSVESDRHAIVLDIEGLTCGSCVQRVERALERVPGVQEASVNLAHSVVDRDLALRWRST